MVACFCLWCFDMAPFFSIGCCLVHPPFAARCSGKLFASVSAHRLPRDIFHNLEPHQQLRYLHPEIILLPVTAMLCSQIHIAGIVAILTESELDVVSERTLNRILGLTGIRRRQGFGRTKQRHEVGKALGC